MNRMQQNLNKEAGPDEETGFRLRVYRKNELARLYFPQADKKGALQGLSRWIKHCAELEKALEAAGYDKNRKFYLKPEVALIVKFLGEP
ncbi:DUF4248 domain-containing protein [uncultured Bacteroides sp.]|uniref:DUF4248 domain-containing protein n=1 Tax=uncultured Bacteroides sp. TaxID=162156 RepID=UPI00280B56C3|nr:DUF4248 domain-containing protein [uncultured Bacteroides sp.]